MITTLYSGAIVFIFLASVGVIVAGYNRILHLRARMAARCYLAENKL